MTRKLITHMRYPALALALTLGVFGVAQAATGNIDATDKWAWGTNVGWVNFDPANGGVTVFSDHLEGYAWAENVGWIRLGTHTTGGTHTYANSSATNYSVNVDGSGNLSGYAWGTNVGWINFNPSHGQVIIDLSDGSFDGYAWGENIGWIHFKNTGANAYNVVTSYRPPSDAPSADFSGSVSTDENGFYSINGFRGFVFVDAGEQRATGGNHFRDVSVTITSEGTKVCVVAPPAYEVTGVSVNQGEFEDGAICFESVLGARVGFGIRLIGAGETETSAQAVLPAGVQVLFSPGGGRVGDDTLGVYLVVPQEAVPSDGIPLSIDPLARQPVVGSGFLSLGRGATILAYSRAGEPLTDFKQPTLKLCITYDDSDLRVAGGDSSNLEIVTVNAQGGFVIERVGRWTDPAAQEICVDIDHLSDFALLARTPSKLPETGAAVSPLWGMGLLALLAGALSIWAVRAWRQASKIGAD